MTESDTQSALDDLATTDALIAHHRGHTLSPSQRAALEAAAAKATPAPPLPEADHPWAEVQEYLAQ